MCRNHEVYSIKRDKIISLVVTSDTGVGFECSFFIKVHLPGCATVGFVIL